MSLFSSMQAKAGASLLAGSFLFGASWAQPRKLELELTTENYRPQGQSEEEKLRQFFFRLFDENVEADSTPVNNLDELLEQAKEDQGQAQEQEQNQEQEPASEENPKTEEERSLEVLLNAARKEQDASDEPSALENLLNQAREQQQPELAATDEPTSEQLAEQENLDQLLQQARGNEQQQQQRLEEARAMDEPVEAAELTQAPLDDPRAWLENLITEMKAGEQMLGLGFGQFSLREGLSSDQLASLQSRLSRLIDSMKLEPSIEFVEEIYEQENHAIVLVAFTDFRLLAQSQARPRLLILPVCLLRSEQGEWQISASVTDFSAADVALDGQTQAQLSVALQWAQEKMLELREPLIEQRLERREKLAEGGREFVPTQAQEMFSLAAKLMLPSEGYLDSQELETLRALLGRAGANLREDQLLGLWLRLEAWNPEQGFSPRFSGIPSAYEIVYQDPLIEEKGDDLRQLVLIRPRAWVTSEEPLLAALYLRRKGSVLVFSPGRISNSEFPSLRPAATTTGQGNEQNPNRLRERLLTEMILRASEQEMGEDLRVDSAQQLLERFIASAREGDWATAFALVSFTQVGVAKEKASRSQEMVKQLLRLVDVISRGMVAPRFREVYQTSAGTQALWLVEGMNRAQPSMGVESLPLSLRKTEQGWRIDFSLLSSPEAVREFQNIVEGSSYGEQLARQILQGLPEYKLEDLAAMPTEAQLIKKASEPTFMWEELKKAWRQNQVSQLIPHFGRLEGAGEREVLADFRWFFEVFGHPSHPLLQLSSVHQQGDWAALTWSYTLEEGVTLYISGLAVKLESAEWKLLLPSLAVESASELEFVQQYLREPDPRLNQAVLQNLRQQGLYWARKLPDYFEVMDFRE